MKYAQEAFLKQFDQPIRKYIIEFCNQISQKQYDVLILLARKAACFLSSLEDLQLITLNGTVVSERALEYDTNWLLEDKKIAIIDDTIISGTSIYKIINKLKKIGVQKHNISVHAFCINEYWFVNELLEDEENQKYLLPPFLKIDHTSSLRFCKQIVDALSIVPRPYNIDFPIYEKIKFTTKNYLDILEDKNWKINNTATQLQKKYNINSISINLTRKLLSGFNESLGADFKDILFFKLRMYSEETVEEKGQPHYLCKVVPFVISNPISINFANELIKAICNCEKIEVKILCSELNSETSKLLFIQYYMAERLFKWWANFIEKIIGKELKYAIDKRSLYLLFPPQIIEIISKLSFNQKIIFNPKQYHNFSELKNITYSNNVEPINPLSIKDKLLAPFLKFYYEKELPARRIVKAKKEAAFDDETFKDIMDRLEDGIPIIDLKKEISKIINNSSDANLMLSLFLDSGIDTGLIVPITINKGTYLCRGYRHGEEIVWGITGDKLLSIFYKHFIEQEKQSLSKFWLEKLTVLFLKLGLKKGIFQEYDYSPKNKNVKLIGVRSYLQGQITVSYDIEPYEEINYNPILDYETKEYWNSKRLLDLGFLQPKGNDSYCFDFDKLFYKQYSNKKNIDEVDDLDPSLERETLDIADLLKICKDNKILDYNGLVQITSCLSLHDNTASIGAELYLFNQNLASYENNIRSGRNNLTIDILSGLREKTANYLWTAINSGREKYLDYKKNKGVDLVNSITKQLSTMNSFAGRRWEECWKDDIELIKNKNDENELGEINDRMGIILIDINSTIIYIHILMYILLEKQSKINDFKKQSNETIQTYKKEIANKKSQLSVLHKNIDTTYVDSNNTSLIQNIEQEIKDIEHTINSIYKKLEYWDNYLLKNIDRLKSNSQELSGRNYARLKSQNFILEILSENYKYLSEQEMWYKIDEAINILLELQKDSKDSLKDFLLIVPQFGKIQKRVMYSSIIHLNCLSTNNVERDKLATIIKSKLSEFELEEYGEQTNDKSIVLLKTKDAIPGQGYIIGGKGQLHFERLLKLSCRILWVCHEHKLKIIISLIPCKSGIKAFFNNGTKAFDTVKESLFKELPKNDEENQIIIFGIDENKVINLKQVGVLKLVLKHFDIDAKAKDIFAVKINEEKKSTSIKSQEAMQKEIAKLESIISTREAQGKADDIIEMIKYLKNSGDLSFLEEVKKMNSIDCLMQIFRKTYKN